MLYRLPVLKTHYIYYSPSQKNNSKILRQIINWGIRGLVTRRERVSILNRKKKEKKAFINQDENQQRKSEKT